MTETTVADALTASLRSHGRADYRAGRPFSPASAKAWRDGWTDEAHLAARAAKLPEVARAMDGLDALAALEAAHRVETQCTVSRPSQRQQSILNEARALTREAIARLRGALDDGEERRAGGKEIAG